jgi:hypothetical protein
MCHVQHHCSHLTNDSKITICGGTAYFGGSWGEGEEVDDIAPLTNAIKELRAVHIRFTWMEVWPPLMMFMNVD